MIKQIFSGIASYTEAFGLLSRLKLWKYFIIPTAISVCTVLTILYAAYEFSGTLGHFLAESWIWDWGK